MKKQVEPKRSNDDWKGYVNYSPSVKEREEIEKYGARYGDNVDRMVAELVECGYSVTFAADKVGGAFRCAVTGKTLPCSNIGYTLSIRASSIQRCLAIVGYYCFVLCDSGGWLVDKVGEEVW